MIRGIILWRWLGREASLLSLVTGVVMIGTSVILLVTDETGYTTLYARGFWGGRIQLTWLAWGILIGGLIIPFRMLKPIHMFIITLPWTLYFVIIALVTLADPGPFHPVLRAWFWAHAPLLTGASALDNIRVERDHRAL